MRLLLASLAVLAGLSAPAVAGGMAEPVMEPETVAEDTAGSGRDGWVIPLLLLVLIITAATADDVPIE